MYCSFWQLKNMAQCTNSMWDAEPVLILSFWPNIYERRHYQRKKKSNPSECSNNEGCFFILLHTRRVYQWVHFLGMQKDGIWAQLRNWEGKQTHWLTASQLVLLLLPQQSVCFSHTFLHIRLSDSKKVSSADTYSARFTQHKSQFIMLQHHTKNSSCFIR